jgi:hypothetical protein
MEVNTLLCEGCGLSLSVWGYNDCDACLNRMHEAQRMSLLTPEEIYAAIRYLEPRLFWCSLCQCEVTDCLHRKQARKDGRR